jgi:hypothetical protein
MSNPNEKQIATANTFLAAFNAYQASTPVNRKETEKALDLALIEYRKAHKLGSANGLLDCINHFNQTHAV